MTDDLKFAYAWHLVKSRYKNDIRKGIRLMDGEPMATADSHGTPVWMHLMW